jgi:type IV pilus assembly protein PilE
MRVSGFTLVELLVVLAIMAIISAIALPIYSEYSQRTMRREAQGDLMNCAQGMERHASRFFTYANAVDTDADDVGDDDTGPVSGNICNPLTAQYAIAVMAPVDANQFTLRATPAAGPVGDDGIIEIDSAGNRRWDEDNDGNFDAGETDWIQD